MKRPATRYSHEIHPTIMSVSSGNSPSCLDQWQHGGLDPSPPPLSATCSMYPLPNVTESAALAVFQSCCGGPAKRFSNDCFYYCNLTVIGSPVTPQLVDNAAGIASNCLMTHNISSVAMGAQCNEGWAPTSCARRRFIPVSSSGMLLLLVAGVGFVLRTAF